LRGKRKRSAKHPQRWSPNQFQLSESGHRSTFSSNAATINVGDAYSDLGAIVHDNQGNDLSYRTFINGVLSGNILIDTSQAATDTIDYDATDTWGNTSTGTRAVIVDPSATPQQLKRQSVRYCLIGAYVRLNSNILRILARTHEYQTPRQHRYGPLPRWFASPCSRT